MQEDRDIQDIRAGLSLREGLVKDAEARTRGQHDYRFVLQYFSASRDLHRTLVANVNYLANEVEQLRANSDHNSESISIMEQQFVELEVRRSHGLYNIVYGPEGVYFLFHSCPPCLRSSPWPIALGKRKNKPNGMLFFVQTMTLTARCALLTERGVDPAIVPHLPRLPRLPTHE